MSSKSNSNANPNQEISQLIRNLSYINQQSPDDDLIEKLKSVKCGLKNFAPNLGSHKNKFESILWPVLDSKNEIIQKLAVSCITHLAAIGGGGANGQLFQEAWLHLINNSLLQANELVDMLAEVILNRESMANLSNDRAETTHMSFYFDQSKSEDVNYLTNRLKGLTNVICNLMGRNFPTVVSLPVKNIVNLITKILDCRLISVAKDRQIFYNQLINVHILAFRLLQSFILCSRQTSFIHSNVIYDCMAQSLQDCNNNNITNNKNNNNNNNKSSNNNNNNKAKIEDGSGDVYLIYILRTEIYTCMKHCLLYDILPSSLTTLKLIVEAAILDFTPSKSALDYVNNHLCAAGSGMSSSNKQLLTTLSNNLPNSKKRKKHGRVTELVEIPEVPINGNDVTPTNEQSVMCVTALEALQLLMTSDLTSVVMMTSSESSSSSSSSCKSRSLERLLIPVWRSAITIITQIQQHQQHHLYHINNNNSKRLTTILEIPSFKLSIYRLLSAMMTKDIFRYSHLFLNAVGIFQKALSVDSDIKVIEHSKLTLSWLKSINYSFTSSSHPPPPSSTSSAFSLTSSAYAMTSSAFAMTSSAFATTSSVDFNQWQREVEDDLPHSAVKISKKNLNSVEATATTTTAITTTATTTTAATTASSNNNTDNNNNNNNRNSNNIMEASFYVIDELVFNNDANKDECFDVNDCGHNSGDNIISGGGYGAEIDGGDDNNNNNDNNNNDNNTIDDDDDDKGLVEENKNNDDDNNNNGVTAGDDVTDGGDDDGRKVVLPDCGDNNGNDNNNDDDDDDKKVGEMAETDSTHLSLELMLVLDSFHDVDAEAADKESFNQSLN